MIQLKRGSTESWKKLKKPLAAGQPGYDKDKHRLKVGDGETLWEKLKAVGLSKEEILDSEQNAKLRLKEDPESLAIMTYGSEDPDKNTVGELYLQHYEAEPEVDYVVKSGVDGIWYYRKWHSGRAECCGTHQVKASVNTKLETLFSDERAMEAVPYPFAFNGSAPSEVATVHGDGGIVWLALRKKNSNECSAEYSIISPHAQQSTVTYQITLRAEGFWR